MKSKICYICGNNYFNKNYVSIKQWSNSKYCSAKCYKRNGLNNPRWKGGVRKLYHGYIGIYSPHHPYVNRHGIVQEHRLVMEKYLGRFLKPEENVHHTNGIKDDNRIENLMLFSNLSKHMKFEFKVNGHPWTGRHHTEETKRKISLKNYGRKKKLSQHGMHQLVIDQLKDNKIYNF